MTPEERAMKACLKLYFYGDSKVNREYMRARNYDKLAVFEKTIQEAVDEERERCAVIAGKPFHGETKIPRQIRQEIARRIREQEEKQ